MGNRTIQAKIVKIKKYKRLAPRKYYADQVHVNIPRKPEFYGNPRTRYLGGTTSHQEAELRARAAHMLAMYPSFCVNPFTGEHYKDNEPRRLIKELVNGRIPTVNIAYTVIDDDVPLELHVVLESSKFGKTVFYTNVGHTKNYFVKEDLLAGLHWRSQSYGSRNRAMIAYRYKTIEWGKPIKQLPLTAGPPLSG